MWPFKRKKQPTYEELVAKRDEDLPKRRYKMHIVGEATDRDRHRAENAVAAYVQQNQGEDAVIRTYDTFRTHEGLYVATVEIDREVIYTVRDGQPLAPQTQSWSYGIVEIDP